MAHQLLHRLDRLAEPDQRGGVEVAAAVQARSLRQASLPGGRCPDAPQVERTIGRPAGVLNMNAAVRVTGYRGSVRSSSSNAAAGNSARCAASMSIVAFVSGIVRSLCGVLTGARYRTLPGAVVAIC